MSDPDVPDRRSARLPGEPLLGHRAAHIAFPKKEGPNESVQAGAASEEHARRCDRHGGVGASHTPGPGRGTEPVGALLRAAHLLQAALAHLGHGASFEELLSTHLDYLLLAGRVVDSWGLHLGVDFEKERMEGDSTPAKCSCGSAGASSPVESS
jgi:hypothetical protein